MACRGCSQSGDCACAVIGDSDAITVTGTGSAEDPFEVTFNGTTWVNALPIETPDYCEDDLLVLTQLEDDSLALVMLPKPCAHIL